MQTLNCLSLKISTYNIHTHIRSLKKRCDVTTFLDSVRIGSTDRNFGTDEKVVIPISIVTCTLHIPILIFDIFVFSFPRDYHGILIPMHTFPSMQIMYSE